MEEMQEIKLNEDQRKKLDEYERKIGDILEDVYGEFDLIDNIYYQPDSTHFNGEFIEIGYYCFETEFIDEFSDEEHMRVHNLLHSASMMVRDLINEKIIENEKDIWEIR